MHGMSWLGQQACHFKRAQQLDTFAAHCITSCWLAAQVSCHKYLVS
jgi:hypothetical protein